MNENVIRTKPATTELMTASLNYFIYDVIVSGLDKRGCNGDPNAVLSIKSDRKGKKNELSGHGFLVHRFFNW